MGFDWFRVDSALANHPKVLRLAIELGDDNAGWHVIRLWSWLTQYAPRGLLRDDLQLPAETAAGWRGEPRKLLSVLVLVGLLEKHGDGTLEAHDWWEKQGPLVEKANKDAARKRKARRAPVRGLSADCPAPVRVTARVEDGRDGHYTTGRDGRDDLPKPRTESPVVAKEPTKPTDANPPGALRDAMDATFVGARGGAYHWSSADELAVGALLGQASSDQAEILRRWSICLAHVFPTWATVTDLSRHWNACAAAQTTGPPRGRDTRRDPIRAEDVDWTNEKPGETHL